MGKENTGNKETCNECFLIWGWIDTVCPECGSDDIETYHQIGCKCSECKQGVREDSSINEFSESQTFDE